MKHEYPNNLLELLLCCHIKYKGLCANLHNLIPLGGYIFTIIKIGVHPIITLRMALTTLPDERSLSSSFTTFAHVASHASPTCWRPVSRCR